MTTSPRTPFRSVNQLVDEFLADYALDEVDPKDVLEAGVKRAERRLASDPRCNAFLIELARRLGVQPVYLPWVTTRLGAPDNAQLLLAWDEEGAQLVGNREGLRHLARLIETLADSDAEADHAHAEPGYELLSGSENLTLVLEHNQWFRENRDQPGSPNTHCEHTLPHRNIDEDRIAGILITDYVPDIVGLSSDRILPVLAVLPYEEGDPVWKKGVDNGDPERYRILKLEGEDGSNFDLAVHLDDETVAFLYKEDLKRTYRLIFEKH